jgi:hypothetical protein
MKEDNIIQGYQGVMDLDLSSIDSRYKDDAIRQHLQDIEEYKKEQIKLPRRLRYENTILHALKIHKMDEDAAIKHARHLEFLQKQKDDKNIEIYNRICEIKKGRQHNF